MPRGLNDAKKSRGFNCKASGQVELSAQLQAKLAQVKARSNCLSCGRQGHWKGDPECPNSHKDKKAGPDRSVSSGPNVAKAKSGKAQKFAKRIGLVTVLGCLTMFACPPVGPNANPPPPPAVVKESPPQQHVPLPEADGRGGPRHRGPPPPRHVR